MCSNFGINQPFSNQSFRCPRCGRPTGNICNCMNVLDKPIIPVIKNDYYRPIETIEPINDVYKPYKYEYKIEPDPVYKLKDW